MWRKLHGRNNMTDFTEIGITLPPSALNNNEVVKVKCPSCGPSRKDKGDKSMSVCLKKAHTIVYWSQGQSGINYEK